MRYFNRAWKCRSKLRGADHCTLAERMTSILRHVAEAFPPVRQGTILNNRRIIGNVINTSMVLNCALVTYANDDCRGMTAGCSLTSYKFLEVWLKYNRNSLITILITAITSITNSQSKTTIRSNYTGSLLHSEHTRLSLAHSGVYKKIK